MTPGLTSTTGRLLGTPEVLLRLEAAALLFAALTLAVLRPKSPRGLTPLAKRVLRLMTRPEH